MFMKPAMQSFLDGGLIFLSGSPDVDVKRQESKQGRLSGIVNHEIPAIIRTNQKPSYAVNCIEDWEEKLERIVDETLACRHANDFGNSSLGANVF